MMLLFVLVSLLKIKPNTPICVVFLSDKMWKSLSGKGDASAAHPVKSCSYRMSHFTWSAYDTDRPTRPGLRVSFPITAKRAANNTMQFPMNSIRTPSHLHDNGRPVRNRPPLCCHYANILSGWKDNILSRVAREVMVGALRGNDVFRHHDGYKK